MSSGHAEQSLDLAALKARLSEVLEKFPMVEAAYLFGSHSLGKANDRSDLDIALVVERSLGKDKLDLLATLADAGLEHVDLVELDRDDIVMRHEAVRPNRLLHARPDFDHGAFFSRTIREYSDFKPYLDRHRQAYRRSLEHGSS